MTLTPYGFNDITNKFLALNNFIELTEVQKKVIPIVLKGYDLIAISATGTGKTHAFLIPLMEMININENCVQAVITAPTRELAMQIYQNSLIMKKALPALNIKLISGGTNRQKVSDKLKVQPHIVIGTPGRIKDLFLQEETLLVNTAKIMVIDEGDMTLEYGFMDDIDAIAGKMGKKLQMLVFSATIPQGLKPFLKKYMFQPKTIKVDESLKFSPKIDHILIPCKHKAYHHALLEILPGFQPYVCLIFANKREEAALTADYLRDHNYRVLELHGDLTSRKRKQALASLNAGDYQYIVATDIASRGLDVDAVSHVVSLGFPTDLNFYIHRSGRTGRSGREGICYALYQPKDERSIRLLKEKGIKFKHQVYRNENWQTLKPFDHQRIKKPTELDREIAKIVTKKETVKPGYKKRRAAEIAKLKQKKKREMIKKSISEQKKERAKAKQREQKNTD
ncbi:MAG: DEAD/DEAH box helicase [Erysipelotrichaceae bacterium]|nr:DEAD/DEAH box helicase [Erysipelotrichaceae bacterium]